MEKIRILIICFLFVAVIDNLGQSMPEVIPASPRAESFHVYGKIPVSYNTGVPDISIPLYTIVSAGVEINIVLRYHIRQVKPPDNSEVAFGWTLEYGGLVSRNINSHPDVEYDRPLIWKTTSELSDQFDYDVYSYLRDINNQNGLYDAEYDIFSYSFLNKHGNFIINKDASGVYQAILLPYEPFKIDVQTTVIDANPLHGTGKRIDNINVVDENGNLYRFGYGDREEVQYGTGYPVSSWMLKSIVTPDNIEAITYVYANGSGYTLINRPSAVVVEGDEHFRVEVNNLDTNDYIDALPWAHEITSYTETKYDSIKTIKEIDFIGGKVIFELSNDNNFINSLKIVDKDESTIKSVQFVKSKFAGMNYNKLDNILVKDKVDNTVQKYSFKYDETGQYTDGLYRTDYWGYFSGTKSNEMDFDNPLRKFDVWYKGSSLGDLTFHRVSLGSALNKESSESRTKHYTLQKITYPSGGETEFEFEINEYYDTYLNVNKQGGGLRIKKIINRSNGSTQTNEYNYGPGVIPLSFYDPLNYTSVSFNNWHSEDPNASPPRSFWNRSRNVTMSSTLNGFLGVDNNVYYGSITEYEGDISNNIGKTVYEYIDPNDNECNPMSAAFIIPQKYGVFDSRYKFKLQNWGNNLLEKKTVFKKLDSGYDTLMLEKYEYDYAVLSDFKNRYVSDFFPGGPSEYENRWSWFLDNNVTQDKFYFDKEYIQFEYTITSNLYKLEQKTVTNYFGENQKVLLTERYFYHDGPTRFPTRIEKETSENTTDITVNKYPYNFSTIPYATMENRNIISPLIESTKSVLINGVEKPLSGNFIQYKDWSGDGIILKPEIIKTYTGNNPYEIRIRYHAYDHHGNALNVSKENDHDISYIWGYDHSYPVAKIVGADYNAAHNLLTEADKAALINPSGDQQVRDIINKIRAHSAMANVMVYTYTYKPLVGMTSMTDQNGVTSFYEYDNFNRIQVIKDNDGNIIKAFSYQYKKQ